MKPEIDVAIIGAGPYGLSIAAHLRAAGIEHRVFGGTMESWSNSMPAGMCLKSLPLSSNLFDPDAHFTLKQFSKENGLDYDPIHLPVKLENFIAYGKAFQERFVPQVEPWRLIELCATGDGHELSFDNGQTVTARRVVLASGILPFRHTPSVLASLPPSLVSHSGDYGSLDGLKGKAVTVLGAGSSALDIAALASLQSSTITLMARRSELEFQPAPTPTTHSFLRRVMRRLYAPPSHGIGDGWGMLICAQAPQLVHLLPDALRSAIVKTTLGPSGGYFIRDQIEKHVTMKLGCSIRKVEEDDGRIRLTVQNADGRLETSHTDHIVAATGYRVDVRRLGFLNSLTLAKLRVVDQTPILSADFESSVPGLHFAGLTAARSFGPVLRFAMGAVHPARRLARLLPTVLASKSIAMQAVLSD